MNYTDLHYQTAVSLLFGIGPKRGKELCEKIPDYFQLFFDEPENLSHSSGYRKELFQHMDRQAALDTAEEIINYNDKHNIRTLFHSDPEFPHRLNKTPDGPLLIYAKGGIRLNEPRYAAIVGTRDATNYGHEITKRLVEQFTGNRIVTVSGLATGIDTWVHHYSIEKSVPTIAVLGHGLDRIYPPQNRNIAENIIRSGGTLITEFPPGTMPDRENFPKRNRIVAGMSDTTIVIESKKTGGSLITARLANDYNRDVFAVPGAINKETSQGCNLLIENNEAHLLESPERFLLKMGWQCSKDSRKVQRSLFPELNPLESKIVHFLKQKDKQSIDHIAIALELPVSTIQSSLFMLELKGIIQKSGGQYIELIA